MEHYKVGYAIIYAYYVLHSSYMFLHYHLAIFREMTSLFLQIIRQLRVTIDIHVLWYQQVRLLKVLLKIMYINVM